MPRVPRDATVLDLAAGTGKLTRVLVERFARVIAVEPLEGMREVLEELVPGAQVLAGEAEAIPLDDASVDAVFVAEAFHWFGGPPAVRGDRAGAPTRREARPDVERARRADRAAAPGRVQAADPRAARRDCGMAVRRRQVACRVRGGAVRPDQGRRRSLNAQELDRETMLASVRSWSWIASLSDEEREREVAVLRGLLPEETWTIPIRVDVYWARRT